MPVYGLKGKAYYLEPKPFKSGGEGDIFNVENVSNKVAKIYHTDTLTKEKEDKLKIMLARPPNSSVLNQVGWPLDIVYESDLHFCGFVMPKLNTTGDLVKLYEYSPNSNKVTMQQKLIVAENICAVISEVHKAGYIFRDFNPHNIGINLQNGTVAFFDTDTYHIYDQSTGKTYRCKVCLDGYVAPEIIHTCENFKKDAYATAPLPTFTKETDNFALAIHIFKLLMNGYTPFNGIKETQSISNGSPGIGNHSIKFDNYCFKHGNKPQAVAVPPLETLPLEISILFTKTFINGRSNPKLRPSAFDWHAALVNYEKSLKTCIEDSSHQYLNTLAACPWCEADERFIVSITPNLNQKTFSPQPIRVPSQPQTQPQPQPQPSSTSLVIKNRKESWIKRHPTAVTMLCFLVILWIVWVAWVVPHGSHEYVIPLDNGSKELVIPLP